MSERLYATGPIPPSSAFNRHLENGGGGSFEAHLDRALKIGDTAVAQVLADMNITYQERRGPSVELARSFLKRAAIPLYDELRIRNNGRHLDAAHEHALDEAFPIAAKGIEDLMATDLSLYSNSYEARTKAIAEITGGTTELAFFSLFNYDGGDAPYLVTPTSKEVDEAGYNKHAVNLGADFILYERQNIEAGGRKIQVKTSRNHPVEYRKDIIVLYLSDLFESEDARQRAKQAIIAIGNDTATNEDYAIITPAERLLNRIVGEALHGPRRPLLY